MQDNPIFKSKLPGLKESIFSVMSKLAVKEQAINLSQGYPDFDIHPALADKTSKYIKNGFNQYAPMAGVMSLREKIADKMSSLYGANYDPEKEITITPGATSAIYIAIGAVISEGDEVIIIDPAYDAYAPAVSMNGGVPIHYSLSAPDYKINWSELKQRISIKTKMIIVNTPQNPSGTILSDEDMKQLEKVAESYDLAVLSDEVYEHIVFDGLQHHSACKYPNLKKRTFLVFSFGKTYHVTGWKIGYVLAPEYFTAEFRKIYQYAVYATNTPMQYALTEIMADEDLYRSLGAFYQEKRDVFRRAVEGSRFEILPCHGSYFQSLSFKNISDQASIAFAEELAIQHKVASVPSSVFYHRKHDDKVLRFCFAKKNETLEKAGEILCKI